MKLNLFTRTDSKITHKTIRLFYAQMRLEKKTVIIAATCIPLGNFLYQVLLPLFISLLTQSLIVDPHNVRTTIHRKSSIGI